MAGCFDARQARDSQASLQHFNATELATLEALGDELVPGSREAGIAHFIDHELASDDPKLVIRYFNTLGAATYPQFYSRGLADLDRIAHEHGAAFADLAAAQRRPIIEAMRRDALAGWTKGDVASMFYTIVRSDGIDTVYGTTNGFAKLGVPYIPHIVPQTPW
jgi:hypothetical protein